MMHAGKHCAGCAACEAVCAKKAIQMQPDAAGFLYPVTDEEKCIRCFACERVCPVLNWKPEETRTPLCFAAKAGDEIRRNASSGGIFPLLCDLILSKEGVVYGAAMDHRFRVHHTKVTEKDGISVLYRSKYVQSSMEGVYDDLLNEVLSGKTVLFSGTPCQVAAVRNYLGEEKLKNVFLVDVLCHGVPSQKMWEDYLRENFDIEEIQAVDFRNKEPGWKAEELLITYKNGKREIVGRKDSAYEEGFLSNLCLREGCAECVFACIQRPGDLTIGDFWGIEKHDPEIQDHLGISEILVNNQKGQLLLDQIQSRLLTVKEFPVNTVSENRLQPLPSNPLSVRFRDLYQRRGFSESVQSVIKQKYDIGLAAHYCAQNYGAQLTQWALYHILTQEGFSVLMVERPRDASPELKEPVPNLFFRDPYPDYAKSELFSSVEDMKILNQRCEVFITGSDQMFNPYTFLHMRCFQGLNFVTDDHIKIGYALSWGKNEFPDDRATISEEAYYLGKYDAVSVREDTALRMLREDFGIPDTEFVLDPLFLCEKDDILRLSEGYQSRTDLSGRYICVYVLDISDEQISMVIREALKCGIHRILLFTDPGYPGNSVSRIKSEEVQIDWMKSETIECLISVIQHAEYVITDSYHGTCMAVLFGKQFISMANKSRGIDRFTSLLHLLEMDDRLSYSWSETEAKFDQLMTDPISFEKARLILERERQKSRKWLLKAIQKSKPKKFSAYDILDHKIELKDAEINRVIEQLEIRMQQKMVSTQKTASAEIEQMITARIQEQDQKTYENSVLIHQLLRATRWRRKMVTAVRYIKQHGIPSTAIYTYQKIGNLLQSRFHR